MRFSLFTVLASAAFSHAGNFKGIDDMWSFDLDQSSQSNWMETIADEMCLTALSIPGTHSSVTDTVISGSSQTQNIPLDEQLIAGIRYIDITCWYIHHDMMVYNGLTATGYNLKYVLTTVYSFLHHHPSEAIILRIQKGGLLGSSEAFQRALEDHLDPDSEFGKNNVQYIYSGYDSQDGIPTIGQVRGKVVILHDYKTSSSALNGIPWNSNTVSSYDPKLTLSTRLLNRRWKAIKSFLSDGHSQDFMKLRVTYTTSSGGVKPINLAAGNNGLGINKLLGDYVSARQDNALGIVVMDFPGQRLVDEIVKLNEDYQDSDLDDDAASWSSSSSYLSGLSRMEEVNLDEVDSDSTGPVEASSDGEVDDVEAGADESKTEATDLEGEGYQNAQR